MVLLRRSNYFRLKNFLTFSKILIYRFKSDQRYLSSLHSKYFCIDLEKICDKNNEAECDENEYNQELTDCDEEIIDKEEEMILEEEEENHDEYKRIRIDDYLDTNEVRFGKKNKDEIIWYLTQDEIKKAEEFETPYKQDLEKMELELKENNVSKFENQDDVLKYLRSILVPKRTYIKDPMPDPFNSKK